MRFHSLVVVLAVLLVGSLAARVQAQTRERRPSYAVFGAPDPRRSADEGRDGGLSVSGSAFGAYGDDLFGDQGITAPFQGQPQLRGSYYGFNGRLLYARLGEQLSLNVNAASTAGFYPALGRFAVGRQLADVSSSWITSPWKTARISTLGTAQYSQYGIPFTEMASSPDVPLESPNGEDLLRSRRRAMLRGRVQLEQDWGRHKSVAVLAGLQASQLDGTDGLNAYEVGGGFNADVSRYGTFRAAYTLQEVDRSLAHYRVHHVNIGGDYGRPLSPSRRTFVSFRGGSAALESRDETRVFVTADASLNHELGRSWTTRLRYSRGLTFVDEIVDPLMSDGVSADLNGLLDRRIELNGSGSYRRGTVGLSSDASGYDVYGGHARIRLALSRTAAVYAEYMFFHYRFATSVRLGAALPPALDRQTVRMGVTVTMRPLH